MPRIWLKENVLQAAQARISRLFDEFGEILVNFSGGKDSTVILNLALAEATNRGRLPLKVMWLDQKAEWQCVADYIRTVMNDPRVKPYWFQGPFRLFNATTTGEDPWLHCWKEGAQWMRPKEPNSIHDNRTGTDRFKKLFRLFPRTYITTKPLAQLGGVRCEESPGRLVGLTAYATYKDITWGQVIDKKLGHYTFYPIYDWTWQDVWKAIHEHGWKYCPLYNWMYNYGIPIRDMRVSNVHHETAIHSLKFLQEIEPQTWNKIVERVGGVNAVNQMREAYSLPKELPWMFKSWREYRDYLLEKLIFVPKVRETMRRQFQNQDRIYTIEDPACEEKLMKTCISAILVNDFEMTKLDNLRSSKGRRWSRHSVAKRAAQKAQQSKNP